MNISDKVSLYATIPSAIIVALGLASVLLVSPVEARVSIIASTLTAVTLLFLVSERLRESASRKLDYWNKKVLSPALRIDGLATLYNPKSNADTLEQYSGLLKRYARYGRFVKLYPKNFILTLTMFQKSLTEYEPLFQKVSSEGAKGLAQFDLTSLTVVLGLFPQGSYAGGTVENHRKWFESFKKTEPELSEQFTNACKMTLANLAFLQSQIQTFYVENQLA